MNNNIEWKKYKTVLSPLAGIGSLKNIKKERWNINFYHNYYIVIFYACYWIKYKSSLDKYL